MKSFDRLAPETEDRQAASLRELGVEPGQREFAVLDDLCTWAYAEGRSDEQEELASVLPGSYYMDPPDGGGVTLLEQLQRMAKDAELGRRTREHAEAAVACELRCEG